MGLLTGFQYADHLDELFELARLQDRVRPRSEVVEIVKAPGDGVIDVHVRNRGGDADANGVRSERVETLRTRFVVWVAVEYKLLRCVQAVE